MFYAGNGQNLVSFEKKSERDYFVFKHPAYIAENANNQGAYDYPQAGIVKRHPYEIMDVSGNEICTLSFVAGSMFEDWG